MVPRSRYVDYRIWSFYHAVAALPRGRHGRRVVDHPQLHGNSICDPPYLRAARRTVIADVRRLPVATLFATAFSGPRRLRYILLDHEFLGAVARGAGVPAARRGYRDFLCMFVWAHAPIRMTDRGSGSLQCPPWALGRGA